MVNHELHASHTCFACENMMPWTGDVFGGVIISHGNEIDATVSVTGIKGNFVELSVQAQCPECGAVNQFKVLHQK
ncbi:hypothetical protein [Alicyclobacillus dauci]|uniref:Uncharacterized protein n=1 Tax=Alicyclobacillus dauci TaxID=1475485 RepID=A0ABY6Z8E5_9BACL|nr:hypothetical protein [Alicyclobacillus dauci]WAH38441.1 hypothetical protein NZD86_08165 [Alicyclobacillus dauci]